MAGTWVWGHKKEYTDITALHTEDRMQLCEEHSTLHTQSILHTDIMKVTNRVTAMGDSHNTVITKCKKNHKLK